MQKNFVIDRKITIFVVQSITNNMKYAELERKLKAAGCYNVGNNAHPVWFSPITKREFTTGHHKSKEVAKGTLKEIGKQSGVKL